MTASQSNPIPPVVALARLWAFARDGQQTVATIDAGPRAGDQRRLLEAAGHFGEAADELQRLRPDIAELIDVPRVAPERGAPSLEEATAAIAAGIVAALREFDPTSPQLAPDDLIAAGNAAYWLGMAHHVLTGHLP